MLFIHETRASTKMARLHGGVPRGRRRAAIPSGHWKTATFVGALRLSGMTAPMVLDGLMLEAWFLAYVQQVLALTLKRGDVVVTDNLLAHEIATLREAVEATSARLLLLLLPPNLPQ